MNLTGMVTALRRDLHDEDAARYRWTDAALERHVLHAVGDFSGAVPLEEKVVLATTPGSRDIDISGVSGLVMVETAEYPAGQFPRRYRRFSVWAGVLSLLEGEVPDGSDICLYCGKLHTVDASGSTIPERYDDLIICGAAGYAALEWAAYAVNQVNAGGDKTPGEFLALAKERLGLFQRELKRLGRKNRVRLSQLYHPCYLPVTRTGEE